MAGPIIRNWWNTYQLGKSDTKDSNREVDNEDVTVKRQLSISQALRTRQLRINFDEGRPVLSLRAPLDLVQFPSVSCPRWPIECEVISNAIHHIEWEPPHPEPFYYPKGHERIPFQSGEEGRQVVYCIDNGNKCSYFTCSRVGGSRVSERRASFSDVNQRQRSLEFESRFESGNLQKAVQIGPFNYELTLRTDLYTNKHTQWFYFRVRNMKPGVTYRFTIVNFTKRRSLYSQGMRPLLYSERSAEESAVGWQRAGSNIAYYRSQNRKGNNEPESLYSLTWTLQFPYEADTCYVAHCYPYTYSHLQCYLRHISSNPTVATYCKVRVLCHSLAGNAVYVLTVTSRTGDKVKDSSKKAVVVTARVHPGETNGSWMMEGFLDFLLGDSADAQLLRDTFVFKVVPMLNPDGVVVGNYRCSLAGRDLNRNYKSVLRDSFPCVWHTRNMVEKLMDQTDVVLYCDFHGHNRKNNVFMYGCNNREDVSSRLHERVFPLMMSKNASNKFCFKSCKFQVQKSKEGTGRIAMWRLGIKNSYTMEATFGGSTLGDRKGTHFTTQDLKSLGFYVCDTLLDYCDPDPSKMTYCLTELTALLRKEARERLGKESDTDFSVSDLESGTSGSDSSDSDGLPAHLLQQAHTVHAEQTPVKNKQKLSHKKRNRLKSNMQPKVLPGSSLQHIEADLQHEENAGKESIKESLPGRHRRKWQLNTPVRKIVIPAANTNHGDISHVTLWQGCEPVKDDCGQDTSTAADMQRSCPNINTIVTLSPHRVQQRNAAQWRYSSQLLHLSAVLPHRPKFMRPIQHQHQQQQHFQQYSQRQQNLQRQQHLQQYSQRQQHLQQYSQRQQHLQQYSQRQQHLQQLSQQLSQQQQQTCFSRLSSFNAATDRRLLSNITIDHIPGCPGYKGTNSFIGPNRYYVHEDFPSGNADLSNTKWLDKRKEGDVAQVGLLKHIPFQERNRGDVILELSQRKPASHSNVLVPVLRCTDLRGNSLCDATLEDKATKGVLPPVTKSPSSTEWHDSDSLTRESNV
ncbi:cytosolic carboxypeptidase 2 [Dunckerocampus dactyliophorus]|uniref:cytosolic carboxypeptidase 2 n=1 Tax=Dunckerocampus dactyliophorus TaxID=161453 RepID=UPI0024062CFF|nr:cytosolic carboxypeptidase 2 [Dunckerocampus dactyliophorus]XP_054632655.1 cytosolic carboxypeptidase 2 [Dunckerocampus dactyliophorus]